MCVGGGGCFIRDRKQAEDNFLCETCKVGGTIRCICVSLGYGLYDIDITAIAEGQSGRVQVCENNWVW